MAEHIVHDPWAVANPTKQLMRERALLSSEVLLFFLVGYFGVGWLATDPADARTLELPLDAAIPFVLGSVVVYWSILPMGLLPIFVVRDPALFRRVALAYSLAIGISLAVFVVLPVTSKDFRVDAAAFAGAGFAGWLLQLLYTLDPPLNLFPSLHLALAFLAALAAWCTHRGVGVLALAWTACIAVSVCTTKQHFAADVVAGIALGALAHFAIVAHSGASQRDRAELVGHGLALFAALVALFYAGLYGAYLARVEPWTWTIG